jgi:YjzC-like protein
MADQNEFRPGETVPSSGIYTVIHDIQHTLTHEVTCIKGKKFPPCRECGPHPRFKLKQPAHHVEEHDLFRAAGRYSTS